MTRTPESICKIGIYAAVVWCGLALSLLISVSCRDAVVPTESTSVTEQANSSVESTKGALALASALTHLPSVFSVEELVYYAGLIAKVRLIEVNLVYAQTGDVHTAEMEFEFEVIEYLKGGNGSNRIWGVVELPGAIGTDLEEVQARAIDYLNARDTRWDDLDAIIFMGNSHPDVPSTQDLDRYYLGWFVENGLPSYSIAASRGWLPSVPSDMASAVSNEQHFLLDHPDGHALYNFNLSVHPNYTPKVSGTSEELNSVGLNELKKLIAKGDGRVKQQIDATATANWWWMSEPRNLTASATHNSVTLNWDEARVPSEVSEYLIFRRKENASEFIHLADSKSTVMEDWESIPTNISYEDTRGIEPDTTYVYQVLSQAPKYGGGTADGGKAEITVTTLTLGETPTPTTEPTPTHTPAATPTPTATVTPTPTATATPNPLSFGVSASGLATWAYTKPASATFSYYEVRWLPYDSTKDLNDWTGKLNYVTFTTRARRRIRYRT